MADVSIDSSVSTSTARGMRAVVFTTELIGYWFYFDSGGQFVYSKTTDGGATWGAAVTISSATTNIAYDVWFDQWTPGDTGTLIHTWYFDSTADDVLWRTLNTSGDTLGTQRVIFAGATAVAGRGTFVSGTKTRSGYLYCAYDIDAGAEKGFHRSTDGGTTWSANLSTTFVEASLDEVKLLPASNTGDDNDCWAIYVDASALNLTVKEWDSSGAVATESAGIGFVPQATDLTGQYGYGSAVRHSDGHLIVVLVGQYDTVGWSTLVYEFTSIAGGLALNPTNPTSTTDHYYPRMFIDQFSGDIYIAYNGKRDGSETLGTATKVYYVKSTDGGASWSAGDTAYMEGAAAAVVQVWTPSMGPRFYAGWRVGTTLVGNFVNSLTFAAAPTVYPKPTLTVLQAVSRASTY